MTPLASVQISTTGLKSFSSPALTNAVGDMLALGEDDEGFLLAGTDQWFFDSAVKFRSGEEVPVSGSRPSMLVFFTPTEPYQQGSGPTGAVSFIGEGENLRWIYDLDLDDVYETDVGGVCTITEEVPANFLPYSYQFTGTPGYTGLDCCTWQLDSPQTGTLGAGQAIFFHNLDPGDPVNLPPDTDGDGLTDADRRIRNSAAYAFDRLANSVSPP